jgi:hypothetical protein
LSGSCTYQTAAQDLFNECAQGSTTSDGCTSATWRFGIFLRGSSFRRRRMPELLYLFGFGRCLRAS